MLEMRPGCEHCDTDLPATEPGAMICSFECTFCERCSEQVFAHKCPNCTGELVPRPTRSEVLLKTYPGREDRVFKPAKLA